MWRVLLAELEMSQSQLTALPAGAFRGGASLVTHNLVLVGNEGLADVDMRPSRG